MQGPPVAVLQRNGNGTLLLAFMCHSNGQPHYSNTHAMQSTGATRLIFYQILRLLPYFICANSEGSGETARMRSLA